ncbi:uncharacterized protein EKO05_0005694 [Ascochyta rabiei]|uniref:uncharacterized protein n=1 Tax=Didymella rabiei TaxID=5454 RepID=UPI0021FFA836|nr:uncharacterized protein EKO05_0005694 [Ascochyta rabiei]UPX15238.1 hypothetical protein EKO05_0005694 [Ascochyta rabiei]
MPCLATMTDLTPDRPTSSGIVAGDEPLALNDLHPPERKAYGADSDFLCEKCAALTYERMRVSEASAEGQLHHDNWTTLKEAASLGCRLCMFFTTAPLHPKSSSRSVFYSDSSGPLRLKIVQTWKQETTCLHVCVPQDSYSAAVYYLYLKTDAPERIPRCEIAMSDSEHDRLSRPAIDKILTWSRNCLMQHPLCRRQTTSRLPKRVVDVLPPELPGQVRLVDGKSCPEAEYVALSHCWGMMPPNSIDLISKCETDNINLLQDGVQTDMLPKLYQDAIMLTRAIKQRYIWIDSLCIVQDSRDDWASQCGQMSDVYSNSYLTISAMSYENNLRGFQKVRSEDVPPHHTLCPLPAHPGTHIYVRSMIDHKFRNDYLKYRGWAFQELLLSPRVLHFTSTAMAFECDTCTVLERGPGSDSLFGFDAGRKRLIHRASNASGDVHTRHYDPWLHVVQSYSQLELTYTTDRLPALSGIACLVASKTADDYVAGLWRRDIAAGLLWYVWPPQSVKSTYVAPSWSWASTTAVWTFDPARRRFLRLKVIDVHTQLSTSNPYGEISAASLTISGPLKRCTTSQLIRKGHRYFLMKGENPITVRFALDAGQVKRSRSEHFWCLDCTVDKAGDVAIARTTQRRETFFRPHGLMLERTGEEEHLYGRIGAFEVFHVTDDNMDWHKTGFVTTTIKMI